MYLVVKAGGKRIVQKHPPTAAPEPPQKDDDEEYVSSRYGERAACRPRAAGVTTRKRHNDQE